MKKLLAIILFLPLVASSQVNMDTVYIRNLTMSKALWMYHTGTYGQTDDSTISVQIGRINQAVTGVGLNAQVTVDSLPGRLVVAFYGQVLTARTGTTIGRVTEMRQPFAGKAQITDALAAMEAAADAEFARRVRLGFIYRRNFN